MTEAKMSVPLRPSLFTSAKDPHVSMFRRLDPNLGFGPTEVLDLESTLVLCFFHGELRLVLLLFNSLINSHV